jgi:ribosomal protein S18 acetylase RimI-like enzyme
MTYRISFELNPKPEDVSVLEHGIVDDAMQKRGVDPVEFFAFFIRDENNKILGGCSGKIWCGCLHIRHLWVSEIMRGKGYGAKLMLSAENLGSERGCTFAAANTMVLEVVDFYRTLGYEIEFERKGYLKDSVLYFMRRDLVQS